jgi:hypothetical protein
MQFQQEEQNPAERIKIPICNTGLIQQCADGALTLLNIGGKPLFTLSASARKRALGTLESDIKEIHHDLSGYG